MTTSRPQLAPFHAHHLDAAAGLLARRHARQVEAEPLLDKRFSDPDVARAEVQALLDAGATGAVATQGGEVTGYLLGGPREDPVWGDNVWVEAAGHAVEDAETVRDLYGLAAARWADEGRSAHYVLAPATDAALVDAWFRLGFGQQHMHGIREVGAAPGPARVDVRRAVRADIPVLAQLNIELPLHQGRSPVFSAGRLSTIEEETADWEETFDDARFMNVVAEHEGRVIGAACGCALELSSMYAPLMRPERAGFLGFAAVLPDARGLGAGRALGEAVLAWTEEAGFTSAVTDWRVANLLSSRTWPRLGFRPAFARLHRRLGF